jgi:hypothetical protein
MTLYWKASGSTYGKVPSKKQTIFGYKLHLLIARNGVILDFEPAPANECDLEVGFELLSEHTDFQGYGFHGSILTFGAFTFRMGFFQSAVLISSSVI